MRTISLFLILSLLLAFGGTLLADNKAVSDDQITDNVKLKLAGDPDVKGGGIDVEVHEGVVTLNGTVHTAGARQKAEKLTKKVKGVKQVVNQLQVKQ